MTKLHYLSIRSAVILNPDWNIILYQPIIEYEGDNTWTTSEHSIKYNGKDYRQYLSKLNRLEIINIDLHEIGFRNDIPEVFKSNYVTYYYLSKHGGIWFDTDILFIRPLNDLNLTGKSIHGNIELVDVVLSYNSMEGYYSTGILMGKSNNEFYSLILSTLLKIYNPRSYMSATNLIYPQLFRDIYNIHDIFPSLNYANFEMDLFYPFQWNQMDILFNSNNGMSRINNNIIGIHWYNGSTVTEVFLNKDDYNSSVTINQIIKEFNLFDNL